MLLLLLLLYVGLGAGQGVPPCAVTYQQEKGRGQTTGRVSTVDPGGPLEVTVEMTFKQDKQAKFSGIWLEEENSTNANILHYYLRFPGRIPLPKITKITLNKWVICVTEVLPYELNAVTLSVRAIHNRNGKAGSLHFNIASDLRGGANDDRWNSGLVTRSTTTQAPPTQGLQCNPSLTTPLTTGLPPPTKPSPIKGQKREYCGISVLPQKLIFGARDVEKGDWPWVATLFDAQTSDFKCAGTLVGRRFVAIAAHCVTHPGQKTTVKENELVVIVGKYDFSKWAERDVQPRGVRRIILNPDFTADPLTNDIALLYLDDDVDYTIYVRPICLFDEDADLDSMANQMGTVIGWNPGENLQRRAMVPIVSSLECSKFAGHLADGTFCAGNTTASKNCIGDAGGSLLLPRVWQDGNVRWFLRGLPSTHLHNDLDTCARGGYVVFTDAARHTKWIRDVVETTRPYRR